MIRSSLTHDGVEEVLLDLVFFNADSVRQPYYKRTAIWQLLCSVKLRFSSSKPVEDAGGGTYTTWRENRRNALRIRTALPDLSSALDEYGRNINSLIDIAQRRSVRLIFATQPVMWRPNLSPELSGLLWCGAVGDFHKSGSAYYSVEALAGAMEQYNDTLMKICRARGVDCVDLASTLPKDTSVFYDDAHFNESGARKVADMLTQHLLQILTSPGRNK